MRQKNQCQQLHMSPHSPTDIDLHGTIDLQYVSTRTINQSPGKNGQKLLSAYPGHVTSSPASWWHLFIVITLSLTHTQTHSDVHGLTLINQTTKRTSHALISRKLPSDRGFVRFIACSHPDNIKHISWPHPGDRHSGVGWTAKSGEPQLLPAQQSFAICLLLAINIRLVFQSSVILQCCVSRFVPDWWRPASSVSWSWRLL